MKHELTEWAQTVRELEILDLLAGGMSYRKAAQQLGIAKATIDSAISRIRSRAAMQQISAHRNPEKVPDGFAIKGASTYINAHGNVGGQWIKTSIDAERQAEILKEFANHLSQSVKGLAPRTPSVGRTDEDLMVVIPMGDPHFGMHAWWQDAGEDFDLDIAEKLTCAAVDRLVEAAPKAGTGLLLNLGDMFHADNQDNTTRSGHQLDVDGRWAKVQQVGLRAMLHCARRMLEKYERVIVRINKGNHDGHSSYALALMMSCYFHKEPRIEVDLSPSVVWYYQFGKVLIGSTHGDTIKGKDLIGVMAADKPQEWGATKHRYWMVGHVHHQDSKEYAGGVVEYFRTLAARDAWHAGQGYRAGRDMRLLVMHREHGEIERHRVDVAMLA